MNGRGWAGHFVFFYPIQILTRLLQGDLVVVSMYSAQISSNKSLFLWLSSWCTTDIKVLNLGTIGQSKWLLSTLSKLHIEAQMEANICTAGFLVY